VCVCMCVEGVLAQKRLRSSRECVCVRGRESVCMCVLGRVCTNET